jgi:diguanylate cyclase (GGDEF)-like protein
LDIAQVSRLGLLLQTAGILLIAALSFFLTRSIRRDYLRYWSWAWACLALGLSALLVSFEVLRVRPVAETFYYFGEYAFGYLLVAGCRNYATQARLARSDLLAIVPAGLLALILPHTAPGFTGRFIPHALILAGVFGFALWTLSKAGPTKGPGLRIMRIALALLCLDFFSYAPVFFFYADSALPPGYRSYTSLYDLILEVLLAFGTITLVMEDVNDDLQKALGRLEILSRMDPLTQALNRHAFDSLLKEKGNAEPGCAAVVDVDQLKVINDSLGHAAGDAAIRAVAGAIRSVLRADDLVYRLGGDEFLVLLFSVPEGETRRRLEGLNAKLGSIRLPGAPEGLRLAVSSGVAPFAAWVGLEQAIAAADAEMYRLKQARRRD